jgi:GTPase SAR1 family protein
MHPTLRLFLALAIIVLLVLGLQMSGKTSLVHQHIWYLVGAQFTIGLAAHGIGSFGRKNTQSAFTFFVGGSMFRLLVSLALITVYLIMSGQTKTEILTFTFNFITIYLIFAVVEVNSFLSNLRQNSGSQS